MITLLLSAGLLLASQVTLCKASHTGLHQHYFSNGVVQLIIDAYTEEILQEMASRRDLRLTYEQSLLLRQKMRNLYDHIRQHPAIHQRYLWVGKGRPDIDPDLPYPIIHQSDKKFQGRGSSKRKRYLEDDSEDKSERQSSGSSSSSGFDVDKRGAMSTFPAEEICKTNRQWEQVNTTHDFYDNEVEVIQDTVQQFVFSYRCVSETGPCIGISPLYDSECTERYGWMYMYYRRVDDPLRIPQWGFVAAPHHCACKITPKYIPDS